jgi:hypothetical protein
MVPIPVAVIHSMIVLADGVHPLQVNLLIAPFDLHIVLISSIMKAITSGNSRSEERRVGKEC